tara:strand:- start:908 stop:1036 length:129 start_codon:yes stop_codon:yes gene_type:complete
MKISNFDLETTGLDPVKNGIVQIGFILEVDGEDVAVISISVH